MKRINVMIALLVLISTMGVAQKKEFNANWEYLFSKNGDTVTRWLKYGSRGTISIHNDIRVVNQESIQERDGQWPIAPEWIGKLTLDTINSLLWQQEGYRRIKMKQTPIPRALRLWGNDSCEVLYLVETGKMIKSEVKREGQVAKYRDFFVLVSCGSICLLLFVLLVFFTGTFTRRTIITAIVILWCGFIIALHGFTTIEGLYTLQEAIVLPTALFTPSLIFSMLSFFYKSPSLKVSP